MITSQSLLVLILTGKCNLNCAYCLRDAGAGEHELDFNELKRLVLKAYSLGYRRTGITGGEALLYPHFDKLVELLGSLGFWVFLETNGFLLTGERIRSLKRCLGENIEFLTSLDNKDEATNDRFRGKGAWRQALKALSLIKDAGLKVTVNTVVAPHHLCTCEAVEEHISFTRDSGADYLCLSAAVPLGRGRGEAFFVPPWQRMIIRKVLEKNDFFRGFITGHCAHYAHETISSCNRLSQRHNAFSYRGIHPCVYQEEITVGTLSEFDDRMNDGNLMESLQDLRRAALAEYPSRFLDCQDCMVYMKRYLKKIGALVNTAE